MISIVGYGTTRDGVDYWLVRNSWGTSWGAAGFIKIGRGHNWLGIELACSWARVSIEATIVTATPTEEIVKAPKP